MSSQKLAWNIRKKALEIIHNTRSSHIASVFSVADIVAVLYADILKFNNKNPKWEKRDRLILSKGHAGLAVYIALCESGFFSEKVLNSYCKNGSYLQGHISNKNVPGVEVSSGSLGHGICIASGMALAAKMDNKKHRIFTITGDGECDEGSVWETALFANHYELNNLTVIVDHNKMQSLDFCENTLKLGNLCKKWEAFGWKVFEVNGHDHAELKKILKKQDKKKPTCIIAHTIKGKGVSFMENNILWHYRDPQDEYYLKAKEELEKEKL